MTNININTASDVRTHGRGVKFKNLTPHPITLVMGEFSLTIEPSGEVARVTCKSEVHDHLCINVAGEELYVPFSHNEYGEVEGLPHFEPGVFLLVSSLVKARVPDRHDVIVPNDSVRDDTGRIIGCKSFCEIF